MSHQPFQIEIQSMNKFPSKIIGIGRNFKAHAAELGQSVPSKPLFFLKPTSSLLPLGEGPIQLPIGADVHHERRKVRNVSTDRAMDYVDGYSLALDMTARDIQRAAAKAGEPWTVAKGFDTFCPIGNFIPKSQIPNPEKLLIWCKIDGLLRQRGFLSDMVFDIPTIISHISKVMTLNQGDLILTGTPAGVGPVKHGQTIEGGLCLGQDNPITTIKFLASDVSE